MNTNYATQSTALTANADEVRTETLHGREHVVAPVTLVREMVLKGEFLPMEEIEATQLAWNAKPGTITHPTDDGGDFVPASAPDTFDSHRVATLFDVEASPSSNSLDGEVWIDTERSAAVADALDRDDPAAMLQAGDTVEVSVGYWYQGFAADGEHDGEAFDAVQVGIQPDHLALLPNAEGECSIADGCGAGRNDAAGAAMRAPLSALQRGAERLGVNFGAACGDGDCACEDDDTASASTTNNTAPDDMTDQIDRLAEQSAFDADTLADMTDAELDALEATLDDASGTTNDGGDGGDTSDGDDDADAADLADQVAGLVEEKVDERLEAFEREQRAEDRAEAIDTITANTAREADELEEWGLEQLEKYAADVAPQGGVYAGQAGAAGSTDDLGDIELTGITQNPPEAD